MRIAPAKQTLTYQTRIGPDPVLDACAEIYGHVERRLFADVQRGQSCAALKSTYLAVHAIPARMFNSARIAVEGKMKSVQTLQAARVEHLKLRIRKAQKVCAKLEEKQDWAKLHQKKRRLTYLQARLARLESDLEKGLVRVATLSEQGIDLRVRVPDALVGPFGNYHMIGGLHFAYGHDQVATAIENNRSESKDHRQAITYRFKRDAQGWRVFVSVDVAKPPIVTDKRRGVIGVDLNADHLAVAETDRFGNPLRAWSVPLVTYGKTTNQAEALSSVIGRTKYTARYGLTVYQAAALVLAQRVQRVYERPPRVWRVPDGKNDQVTFPVPARTRGKHVWSFWRGVSRALKAALAARYRPARKADPPSRPSRGEGVIRSIPVGAIPARES